MYDVVFHYLMEDLEIAKCLISNIINKKIIHLEPNPTVIPFKTLTKFHVFRMDYAATIKTGPKEGDEYKIIIEIQKASIIEDILRFRRYLAKQYQSCLKRKIIDKRTNETYRKDEKEITFPIISIYFLGTKLETITRPVIKIERGYYDAITNEKLEQTENFIEQLTHDSYVIQIPFLSKKKRTELEEILTIFDQHYIIDQESPHVLNFPNKNLSTLLQIFIKRLQHARENEEIEEMMQIADKYISTEEKYQKELKEARAEKEIERERAEKEKSEKERERAEKEKALFELEELKKQLQELKK